MVDATPTAKTALLLLIFGAIVLMATASDYGENHPTAEENSQSNQVNNANNHHGSGSDATAVAEDDVQNGGDGAFLDSDEEIGREEALTPSTNLTDTPLTTAASKNHRGNKQFDRTTWIWSETDRLRHAHAFVAALNANQSRKWHAHPHQRFALLDAGQRRRLLGVPLEKLVKVGIKIPRRQTEDKEVGGESRYEADQKRPIPAQFDARQQWPACAPHINNIRDQSGCASCWAVAAAGVVTDRLCIAKLRTSQKMDPPPFGVSDADILSCSGAGDCAGGYPTTALNWVEKSRVVSGSSYTAGSYCLPYPFPPRSHSNYASPVCRKRCQSGYGENYFSDKAILGTRGPQAGHFDGYGLVERIQRELMANGPVLVVFGLYDDMYYYAGGIYERTRGRYVMGHAVRLIGWGEGPDAQGRKQPYWLIANSWNKDWGENGFFRILRGNDECGIESSSIDFVYF